MAKRPEGKKAATEAPEKISIKRKDWSVRNVMYFDKYTFYSFTLVLDGMVFPSMKVCFNKEDNSFVTEPSTMGKDGNYYKNYYLNLDQDSQDIIADAVMKEYAEE